MALHQITSRRGKTAKPKAARSVRPPRPRETLTLGLLEVSRRWAALLQQIFEVDPLVCPQCAGAMRIVACITQSAVLDHILTHLRTRAAAGARPGARSPPSTAASVARGARRRPTASTAPHHAP